MSGGRHGCVPHIIRMSYRCFCRLLCSHSFPQWLDSHASVSCRCVLLMTLVATPDLPANCELRSPPYWPHITVFLIFFCWPTSWQKKILLSCRRYFTPCPKEHAATSRLEKSRSPSTFIRADSCPCPHPPVVWEVISGQEKLFPTQSE